MQIVNTLAGLSATAISQTENLETALMEAHDFSDKINFMYKFGKAKNNTKEPLMLEAAQDDMNKASMSMTSLLELHTMLKSIVRKKAEPAN